MVGSVVLLIILASFSNFQVHPSQAVGSPIPPQSSLAGPVISIWNPQHRSGNITDPNLLPGSQVPVSVNVTGALSFNRYSFRLLYNPEILQLTNATLQGTLFRQNIVYQQVDSFDRGIISVSVLGAQQASGNGVLLFTTFNVLQVGMSVLELKDPFIPTQGIEPVVQNGCFHNRNPKVQTVDFSTNPTPGFYETSEYMAGRVAVGIILPQSTGSANHYNWTDDQVSQTINGIISAMNWWASQEPAAHLSFFYDVHNRVPTSYEPIDNPLGQDTLWIPQLMNSLGYPGDAFTATRAYDNAIRNANQTDWAFTIFAVADDPNVNQGLFAGGGYAHAYLGGPFLTMSRYSTWAYNSGQYFQAVPAHETGHIFRATDEYIGSTLYSGYLYTVSSPYATGIMNQNTLQVSAGTEAQIGEVDCDGNGIADILDTPLVIRIDSLPTVITQPIVTVTGKAMIAPYPTYQPGARSVTINKIISVGYSLDQGPTRTTTPIDGSFDEAVESFSFDITYPTSGHHTVYVKAVSSLGKVTTTSFQVDVPSGIATMEGFKARPSLHRLDLSKSSQEILEANVGVVGGSAYVYVQFQINGEDGSTRVVPSQVFHFVTGEEQIISATWSPPDLSLRYDVRATMYYSPWLDQPNGTSWTVGGMKHLAFRVVTG